jgi:hypothetical protein
MALPRPSGGRRGPNEEFASYSNGDIGYIGDVDPDAGELKANRIFAHAKRFGDLGAGPTRQRIGFLRFAACTDSRGV